MAKSAGKKGEQQRTIAALVKRFGQFAGKAHGMRLVMGECVTKLREFLSWTEIQRELTSAYPTAESMIGHKLTVNQLQALSGIYVTFNEGKGIESPDGLWHVDGEMLGSLGLTTAQLKKVADQASAGKLPIKRLFKLARKAQVSTKDDAVREARQEVLRLVGEAKAEHKTLDELVATAKAELQKAQKAEKRAQERVKKAQSELDTLLGKIEAEKGATKAHNSKPAMPTPAKPKRRRAGRQPAASPA